VTALQQTQDGYLWVGTEHGLARFDGLRFRLFDSDPRSDLATTRIAALFSDSAGRLWIGAEGRQIGWFDSGKLTPVENPELEGLSITALAEREGTFWFGAANGRLIRMEGQATRVCTAIAGMPGPPVRKIVIDQSGSVFVATESWAGRVTENRVEAIAKSEGGGLAIGLRRVGGVWLSAEGDLFECRVEDAKLVRVPRGHLGSGVGARVLLESRFGEVWVATVEGGLARIAEGGGAESVEWIGTRDGLSDDSVLDLLEDIEGNLWAAARGGGLNRLRRRTVNVLDAKSGLRGDEVRSLAASRDGTLWISTDSGGLQHYDGSKITRVETGLGQKNLTAIYQDTQGQLWLGTHGEGLFCVVDGRATQVPEDLRLAGETVRAIYEDGDQRLWIGTLGGGVVCADGSQVVRYGKQEGLSHTDISTIAQDSTGDLWFGTNGRGLNRLSSGKITVITTLDGLPSDRVRTLFPDQKGRLWVGTDNGLACGVGNKFTAIRSDAGLPDNVISQIFLDPQRVFWFGSNKGIFRVDESEIEKLLAGKIARLNCLSYTKDDGLSGRECLGSFQPSGCETPDGHLWFPMLRGVAVLDPKTRQINRRIPEIIIEEILADGATVGLGNNPKVPAGCRRIEIRFAAINLTAPKRVRAQYRLVDVDPTWIEAGEDRVAAYSNPPPGKQRFEVRAANSDGIWNELGESVEFEVLRPWWRTWWFIALAVAGSALLVATVVRVILRRRLERGLAELRQQQALANERSRIAADMHDQLGSRLTQICLLGEMARRSVPNTDPLLPHLDRITQQSTNVVRALDEIVWAVNPKNDTLDHIAAYLIHHTEEFLESTGIRYRLAVPVELPAIFVAADVRHHLFLAFTESLTNAARHSGATEIAVSLKFDAPLLTLSVRDNGHGFAPEIAISGDGLRNMRDRLAQIGGQCDVTTRPDAGTDVVFRLNLEHAKIAAAQPAAAA
jgi:ligand-binding sensor domain-containing protein/signal transduction histidine kinase